MRQLPRKIVESLTVVRTQLYYFSPLCDSSRAVASMHEFLTEHDGDKGTVARGVLSFDAEGHTRTDLAALVVAVDGEPVAFKLSRPKK